MASSAMIQVRGLSKSYSTPSGQVTALGDINLSIQSGEIFGVIGRSGAGKSTLIRCLNLLEMPDVGEVIIDGRDLTQLSKQELRLSRHDIAMIFQHFNLLSSRTVLGNICLPLELTGTSKNEIEARVTPLLDLVGLSDRQDAYPSQLSGGQKQRVAIARALASQPKVLLCDEATSALDPQTTDSILRLLKDINAKLGLTIVLITHEMHVIKEICDRVAVIDNAGIVEQNTIAELFNNPQSQAGKNLTQSTLKRDLPPDFAEQLQNEGCYPVVRLAFLGGASSTPVMADMIRKLDVQLNILQANMEYVKSEAMGEVIFQLNSPEKLAGVIDFLTHPGLDVEVLGYVA